MHTCEWWLKQKKDRQISVLWKHSEMADIRALLTSANSSQDQCREGISATWLGPKKNQKAWTLTLLSLLKRKVNREKGMED